MAKRRRVASGWVRSTGAEPAIGSQRWKRPSHRLQAGCLEGCYTCTRDQHGCACRSTGAGAGGKQGGGRQRSDSTDAARIVTCDGRMPQTLRRWFYDPRQFARIPPDHLSHRRKLRRAVAEGIRANASRVVHALNIRNILIATGVLVGSNVLTAGAVYCWAESNLRAAVTGLDVRLSASASQHWRSLMEANPGDLIDKERGPCSVQDGRVACQFNLWTAPTAPKAK